MKRPILSVITIASTLVTQSAFASEPRKVDLEAIQLLVSSTKKHIQTVDAEYLNLISMGSKNVTEFCYQLGRLEGSLTSMALLTPLSEPNGDELSNLKKSVRLFRTTVLMDRVAICNENPQKIDGSDPHKYSHMAKDITQIFEAIEASQKR